MTYEELEKENENLKRLLFEKNNSEKAFAKQQEINSIAEENLKKQKEKAEENEAKFKAVFDNSHDAIGISKAGINVYFNDAYVKFFGYENQNELIGKSVLEQISPKEHSYNY